MKSNPKENWKDAASITVLFTDKHALLENWPVLDGGFSLSMFLFILHFYRNAYMDAISSIPLTFILSLEHHEYQSKCTVSINMYVWRQLDDYIARFFSRFLHMLFLNLRLSKGTGCGSMTHIAIENHSGQNNKMINRTYIMKRTWKTYTGKWKKKKGQMR